MLWVYDLPQAALCGMVVAAYEAVALGFVHLLGPWARRIAHDPHAHNGLVSSFLSTAGIFYGLLLGLVAVGAWQNHSDAEALVSHEASTMAALYRDLDAYPEPTRTEAKERLEEYVRYVIEEAWPLQRVGIVPDGGVPRVAAIYTSMSAFAPASPGEVVLDQEAMRAFNVFLEARQERLDAVQWGLPAILWWVVAGCSVAMLSVTGLFVFSTRAMQYWLTSSIAVTMGLMVFLTIAMDHPFRGVHAIDPDPYELVRSQLMQ